MQKETIMIVCTDVQTHSILFYIDSSYLRWLYMEVNL